MMEFKTILSSEVNLLSDYFNTITALQARAEYPLYTE